MEAGCCAEKSIHWWRVCGMKNKGLRSGILLSYAQYIKRDTRWSVITTEEFHSWIYFQNFYPGSRSISRTLREDILGECWCRSDRSLFTTYHIFSLRIISEKSYKYNVDTHELYIHYKQAHNSTNGTQLMNYKKFGIPSTFVRWKWKR